MEVKEYVLNLLQKKYSFDAEIDLENFNYVESGFVDSIGIIKFVVELEDKFLIEFTDEEMTSPEFRTVNGLINLIERKVQNEKS